MKTLKFNGSSNTSKAAGFAQTLDKVCSKYKDFDVRSTIIYIILY